MKYVVKKGDYLAKIAANHGLAVDDIWNHPANRALRDRDPNVLDPGDVVNLPEPRPPALHLSREGENTYVADVTEVEVALTLTQDGAPLANESYALEGGGLNVYGKSAADGAVRFVVPTHVDHVLLHVPNRGVAIPLLIGHLDTVHRRSGQRARLSSLGFYPPPAGGLGAKVGLPNLDELHHLDDDSLHTEAVVAFQEACGLPATGVMDDTTKRWLLAAYGS